MQIDWVTFSLLTALAVFMVGAFIVYRRRSSRISTDNVYETRSNGVTGLKAAEGGQIEHAYYKGNKHEHEHKCEDGREFDGENEPLTSPFSRRFPNHRLPTPLYHAPTGSQEALVRNLRSDYANASPMTNMTMNTTRNGRTVPDKWRWEAA